MAWWPWRGSLARVPSQGHTRGHARPLPKAPLPSRSARHEPGKVSLTGAMLIPALKRGAGGGQALGIRESG